MKTLLIAAGLALSGACAASDGATIQELVAGREVADVQFFTGARFTAQGLDRIYTFDEILDAARIGADSRRDPLEVAATLLVGDPIRSPNERWLAPPRYQGLCPKTGSFADQVKCYVMTVNAGELRAARDEILKREKQAFEQKFKDQYGTDDITEAYKMQQQKNKTIRGVTQGLFK